MARPKKSDEEKPVKGVKYEDIKPTKGLVYDRKKYLYFLEVYHYLRPYLERELPKINKKDLVAKFSKDKKMVEDVWDCVYELKLKWPNEMIGRIVEQIEE